ncbi:GumC family protein [Mesorhizobium mediterraneum]|nr:Wzz/FepE/Etk N-terminal domain-containing protein [Mesorhizobium mediterraneum]
MLDRNRQHQIAGPGHGQALSADLYYDGAQNYSPYGRDYSEQDEGFNPLKLLFYVVQYRWLIVMMVAGGLVAGVIVTMMQTPKYRATAQLEVLVPSAKVFKDIEVVSEASDAYLVFETAREKLKSRALAQRVVFQLGLSEKPDFLFPTPNFSLSNIFYRAFGISKSPSIEETTPEEREQIAIGRVRGDLTVNLVPNTSLLSITFADQKPKYASDIANQVAQSFIDQRLDQTSETSDLARQFIQEQVLQVKQKLQKSEEELVAYAKDVGITITGDEKSLIGSNIEALNTALATAIQERLDAGRVVEQIDKGRGASLGPVLESEGLQKLSDKLADLTSQYQQKLGILKPGFPEMQQLQSQIKELQRLYNNGVLTITDSLRQKYQ